MSPASVARWVSEVKTVQRTVFTSGVTQSASFGDRLCLLNKTTHDGDRPFRDNPEVVGSNPAPAPNNVNRFRYRFEKTPKPQRFRGFSIRILQLIFIDILCRKRLLGRT